MPHRTQSRNKITPTGRQKRPTVRLYGGGLNRPDRAENCQPRLAAFWAFFGVQTICKIFRNINLQYSLFHAYICRKLNFGGKSMNTMFLYFAYGSNMNPARMAKRCPGAIDLGGAVLRNHRVVERLYADIDFEEGAEMQGVLYVITEEHLRKLDRFEGYPSVYRRFGWMWNSRTASTRRSLMKWRGRPKLPATASNTPKNTVCSVQTEQESIISKTTSQRKERSQNENC